MKFADLHLHTDFSDSTLSPAELVQVAVNADLGAIAITDHDCVEGICPAQEEAKKFELEIIPGIELTAEKDGKEVHILGYFIDYLDKVFLEKLEKIKVIREKRIFDMVEKLKELGVDDIEAQDVFDLSGMGTVGRAHLASILKKKGWVSTVSEAFRKYIGNSSPAYVGKFNMTPEQAIKTILDVGGLPVFAHPHNPGEDNLIPEFVGYGLKGLEVYYPGYPESIVKHYANLAAKYGLLLTGGSDFHGDVKEGSVIGIPRVPYDLVEKLKQAKNEKR
ncbi:MAG: PHP domain-containing protein [Candidatus Omnitrophica bacterium]|nr:PHP domain-containing protein [Candidatus Omnitrophota bacterium]